MNKKKEWMILCDTSKTAKGSKDKIACIKFHGAQLETGKCQTSVEKGNTATVETKTGSNVDVKPLTMNVILSAIGYI
ncbi:hypothetical protein COOONC_25406 [Cooperia oncophora]